MRSLPKTLLAAIAASWLTLSATSGPARDPSPSEAEKPNAVDGRKPVEERKSSEARLAKGEITFDDLKFDIKKDAPFDESKLTDVIKKLNGKRVSLSGYMLPSSLFKNHGIGKFVLVRDNQECCFGPGASLFDCVFVELKDGVTTNFTVRPVVVSGKFVI
ncbi:MAG: DUF3299 domain-containing protein, partial [Planctomycetota bacterium]